MRINRLQAGEGEPVEVAEVVAAGILIAGEQDALDVMVNAGCDRIILHAENLSPDFFRLASGVAGAVLQKFVTFGCRVAIVGSLADRPGESLQALVRESRRSGQIMFTDTLEDALRRLAR